MFESLSDRFEAIFTRLRGQGRLSEKDVDEAMREIRLALLEADVNFTVVRDFVARVRERCLGAEVTGSLTPGQQVVKVVDEELTAILGGEPLQIQFASRPPTVVLMAGLQGSGKTTNSAKLARWFKAQGRNPMLVGADLQRPAAVEQLRTLGSRIDVPVFSQPGDPVDCAAAGIDEARRTGRDVVIVDTAGRLAIDEDMMNQIARISDAVDPHYTFLVVDAMTGQDAVTVAEAFHATLALDGIILTKLDGDARGGAALSVKEVVGRPIAFASTGETLEAFDRFHPDRMADRILGMGDVLTLIEKAEQVYEEEQAAEAAQRLMDGSFTFDDFIEQLHQVKKMGSIGSLVGMLPGIPKELRNTNIDEREIAKVEAIVYSMTPAERVEPSLINGSRRQRIAAGSGTSTARGRRPAAPVRADAEDDEVDGARPRSRAAQGQEGQEEGQGRSGDATRRRARPDDARSVVATAGPLDSPAGPGPPPLGRASADRILPTPRPTAAPSASAPPRSTRGRSSPLDADGQEEATHLPHRRHRHALTPRRPVPRDHRDVPAPPRALRRQGRRGACGPLAAGRRPAVGDRREAPEDQRRHGRLPGQRGDARCTGRDHAAAEERLRGRLVQGRVRCRRPRLRRPPPRTRVGTSCRRRSTSPPGRPPPTTTSPTPQPRPGPMRRRLPASPSRP